MLSVVPNFLKLRVQSLASYGVRADYSPEPLRMCLLKLNSLIMTDTN